TSMARKPSCPISASAWAGKRCSRSQSAAKGSSRSRANCRATPTISRCSSVSNMIFSSVQQLDGHGRGFTATYADRRHPLALTAGAQCRQQGNQDAGTRSADRMAKGAGAPVYIDLGRIQLQLAHVNHADHRKGLVDLEQVYLVQ